MRNRLVVRAAFAPLVALACSVPASAAEIHLETVAEGVWVARTHETSRLGLNALVVDRDDGLLVVDTLGSPENASALLRRLEQDGRKPVRYLVFTHAHVDATGGASAFPEGVLRIASANARDAMADPASPIAQETKDRVGAGGTWTEPPRRLPVLTLFASTRLEDPRNPVEILPLYAGHSPGDLAVIVGRAAVVAAGDVVAGDRNPWGGDADLSAWIVALNTLAKLSPGVVVPLRGETTDARGLRVQREALSWTKGQIERGYVDALPSEEIPIRVLASPDLGRHFDLEASPSFVESVVRAAHEAVKGDRRKRGLPE